MIQHVAQPSIITCLGPVPRLSEHGELQIESLFVPALVEQDVARVVATSLLLHVDGKSGHHENIVLIFVCVCACVRVLVCARVFACVPVLAHESLIMPIE
jgi:hypothetical protein